MASMKYLKNRNRWQVRWHVTVKQGPMIGTVIKGSKTFRNKEAASVFKAETEKQRDYLAAGLTRTEESFDAALTKWFRSIREFTGRTQYLYKQVMAKFAKSLAKDVRVISQLRPIHIRDYLDGLIDEGRTNRTCNVHLTVIKSFCRWLDDYYDVPNAARKIKMLKEEPPKQRFLTSDEYARSLEVSDAEYSRYARFIANTGLRATEFCGLTWGRVDRQMQSLTVTGKGRKSRVVPLNETCRQVLRDLNPEQHDRSEPVFTSSPGRALNRFQLRDKFVRVAKKANVEAFGPHSLRHFFATRLLLNGTHVSIVSKLLGHASVHTTEQTYIHILPEHLTGTTDCLS